MPNGIGIRAPDTSLEPIDAIGISSPVDDNGLQAWAILNSYTSPTTTDNNKILRNFAKGKPNFVQVGSPIIDAASTRFTALSNYLQTDITDTADFTFFIVCKSDDTQTSPNRASFFGTDVNPAEGGGGNTFGVVLRASSGTSLGLTCARGAVAVPITGTQTLTGHNFATWSLVWCRCNGGVTELHNETQNLHAVSGSFTEPRLLGTQPYRIGSGRLAQTGRSDIRDVAHFSRSLSDAEVALMIADIRAKCAARGITV